MGVLPGFSGTIAAAPRFPLNISAVAGPTRNTFAATATPTIASMVPAGTGRCYIIFGWRAEARTLTAATINGVAATIENQHFNGGGTDQYCAIILAEIGTNGSAVDVSLTFSNTVSAISSRVYRATGGDGVKTAQGQFAGSAAAATVTTTMDEGGAILCGFVNIVEATAVTWTNATEDADVNHTDYRFSTAVRTGAAFSGTITADGATDQQVMVTVSIK
jgi:hypothetical protein